MNNSQMTKLSVIAVIAASLLAVGVVAAISMAEQADALTFRLNIARNSASISQSNSVSQSNTNTQSNGGGGCSTC
jgi:hypothetical protein